MKSINSENWPLIRFVAPAFPELNIFSRLKITPLGLVNVATAAAKLWGWRVEIIDENVYRGPRINGLPDHEALQRENPAAAVGFYCGLTSTMDRVYALSKFYKDRGAVNIAGGWHAHYCPEEALQNNFDIVVHGDGEIAIQQILTALKDGSDFSKIPGISFVSEEVVKKNSPARLELPNLDALPYPDFGLLRFAKKIKTYPVSRVRGCAMNCEFCSVKGKPRWADSCHLFNTIKWLVDTRRARNFFIVDDRLEENSAGIIQFFRMISEKYGSKLEFTVQIRLETANNIELLAAMKKAGVKTVCIGFESPIDEDLKAMRKGYTSRDMIERSRVLRKYFWVHGMFIFGYPNEQAAKLSASEMIRRFKRFIRAARISSIQILHPVPLVGTDLRARLEREGRILPRRLVSWSKYDGSYTCFQPRNMSIREFQESPIKLMKWFYNSLSFWKIPFQTVSFPFYYLVKGWERWRHNWLKEIVRYGGHLIIKKWQSKRENEEFVNKLEEYLSSEQNPR